MDTEKVGAACNGIAKPLSMEDVDERVLDIRTVARRLQQKIGVKPPREGKYNPRYSCCQGAQQSQNRSLAEVPVLHFLPRQDNDSIDSLPAQRHRSRRG